MKKLIALIVVLFIMMVASCEKEECYTCITYTYSRSNITGVEHTDIDTNVFCGVEPFDMDLYAAAHTSIVSSSSIYINKYTVCEGPNNYSSFNK